MSTNKRDKFYHTSAEVQDLPFPLIFIKDYTLEQRKNINVLLKELSAKTTSLERKREIADMMPDEWFAHCRFCGKKIVNDNIRMTMDNAKTTIKTHCPSTRYRIIDGKKYELSCCEYCLLEHFKDNPPKSSTLYFRKHNIYGQYSFGYSYEEYKKITSMTAGVTEANMIRKWGEEEGRRRWNEYKEKQAKTNTFEYKRDKYGWTKEEFDEYNRSRACTLKNFIKRHGKEEGKRLWDEYCERQKYTTSIEYMIEEYGEEAGRQKYKEFSIKRSLAGLNSIKTAVSGISQDCFNNLYKRLKELNINNEIYYGNLNKEYIIYDNNFNKVYSLDYYDKTNNLVIEFNGDYWHANPYIYDADDELIFCNEEKTIAQNIWERDKKRKENIEKTLNAKLIVVWESDYRKNPDEVIENIIKMYYS